ncbi:MAG: hypothetical protein JWQ23_2016 [Herminiimonas sp.]|nr:hypothetical protein [Herminiimonas sp.]
MAGALVCGTVFAADGAANPASGHTSAASLFSEPVILRGTLGEATVQASVRPKAEIDEGIEGEYFIFGRTRAILLAGELEGDDVFLEESENGTDVSGQWEGRRDGDTIRGNWLSADGSVSKPFVLKAVEPATAVKQPAWPVKPRSAQPPRLPLRPVQ